MYTFYNVLYILWEEKEKNYYLHNNFHEEWGNHHTDVRGPTYIRLPMVLFGRRLPKSQKNQHGKQMSVFDKIDRI